MPCKRSAAVPSSSGKPDARLAWAAGAVFVLLAAESAWASFHFMHIEQVAGGVNGDTTAQAIQFRMRSNGQDQLSKAELIAWDANGENPIILIDFATNVAIGQEGARVLAATQKFADYTGPAAEPDFILENRIPDDYLAAGSLTFENDEGTLLVCRLSWGGDNYVGPTDGALTNDDDGEFGPPWPDPLPSDGVAALLFQGPADGASTSNLEDYELTPRAATFVNNAGQSFTVTDSPCPGGAEQDADDDRVCDDVDNCPETANADQLDSDDDGAGDACDACPFDAATATDGSICADLDDGTPDSDGDGDDGNNGGETSPDDSDGGDDDGSMPDGDGAEPDDGEPSDGPSNDDSSSDNGGVISAPPMCGLGLVPFLGIAAVLPLAARTRRRCR